MPLIVVIEDDSGTRLMVSQVLKKEGPQVVTAEDGMQGLALIRQHKPDLVVSDVQMSLMDGFEVLDHVRNDPAQAVTAVIWLTSLQDRSYIRLGMTPGADDYLTKSFAPQELREVVSAQLNRRGQADAMRTEVLDKAVRLALDQQRHKIGALYEARMVQALSEQWPDSKAAPGSDKFSSATVLYVDMRDPTLWTQALSSQELSEIVQLLYSSVGDTVYLFGAHSMQFVGDGMLCVFVDTADTDSVNHGLRAVPAALGLANATRRIDAHTQNQLTGHGLSKFSLGVALHSGPVAFASLDGLITAALARPRRWATRLRRRSSCFRANPV